MGCSVVVGGRGGDDFVVEGLLDTVHRQSQATRARTKTVARRDWELEALILQFYMTYSQSSEQ